MGGRKRRNPSIQSEPVAPAEDPQSSRSRSSRPSKNAAHRSRSASKNATSTSVVLYSRSQSSRNPREKGCTHPPSVECQCDELGENVFNFIIPEGQENISGKLKKAYDSCVSQELTVNLIKEAAVTTLRYKTGSIFVLEKFEGQVFKYLEDTLRRNGDFMVIGPQVLIYIFERNVNEFFQCTGVPIFTLAMMDVTVSSTGVKEFAEKKKLIELVKKMGGNYISSYTTAVTHLVASSIITEKAIVAKMKKVPVLSPEWVYHVWDRSQTETVHATDPVFSQYECPIFFNLHFCFSQLSMNEKRRLQQLIEERGGACTGDLQRKVTNILVLKTGEGEKFRHAKGWDIPCVRPEWITDSVDGGYALNPADYIVSGPDHPLSSTLLGSNIIVPDMSVSSFSIISGENMPEAVNATPSNVNSAKVDEAQESMVITGNGNYAQTVIPFPRDYGFEFKIKNTQEDGLPMEIPLVSLEKARSRENSREKVSTSSSAEQEPTIKSNHDVKDDEESYTVMNPATPEPMLSVFHSKKFRLSFSVENDPTGYERTRGMIDSLGGCVVAENFDYVISSPICFEKEMEQFPLFTEYWLIDCDEQNSTEIPKQFYHVPVFNCDAVKGLLQHVVCAISAYEPFERSYIAALASFMGATVQDVFAKKSKKGIMASTHLICKVENDKFQAATRWDIPVITCDWILMCYAKRKKLDTQNFHLGREMDDSTSSPEIPITPQIKPTASAVGNASRPKDCLYFKTLKSCAATSEMNPGPMEVIPHNAPAVALVIEEGYQDDGNARSRSPVNNQGTIGAEAIATPIAKHQAVVEKQRFSLGMDSPLSQVDKQEDSPSPPLSFYGRDLLADPPLGIDYEGILDTMYPWRIKVREEIAKLKLPDSEKKQSWDWTMSGIKKLD